jgi:hypothetical protein
LVSGLQEYVYGLADKEVARAAGQDLEAFVHMRDHAVLVDEGDPVGQYLEQAVQGKGKILDVVHDAN